MFTIRTIEELRTLSATAPERVNLYNGQWHEGEIACVLASGSAAAASEALRIAGEVARNRRVLFFDLQGSAESFAGRCRDCSSPNLLRVDIDLADIDPADPAQFLAEVEQTIAASGARVCVIDSMFFLCEWYCKSGATRFFITKLREMSRRLGISMLVGATARRRIGKTGPTAEHLPKGTAPFIDSIITDTASEGAESTGSCAETALSDTPAGENPESAQLPDIPLGFLSEEDMTAAPLPRRPSTIRRKKRRR